MMFIGLSTRHIVGLTTILHRTWTSFKRPVDGSSMWPLPYGIATLHPKPGKAKRLSYQPLA